MFDAATFCAAAHQMVGSCIPPGQQSEVFPPHPKGTKEYIAVANGTLRVVLGDHHYDLREGDSLYLQRRLRTSIYEHRQRRVPL